MWMHLIAAGQEKYFLKSHNKRFREKKKKRFSQNFSGLSKHCPGGRPGNFLLLITQQINNAWAW